MKLKMRLRIHWYKVRIHWYKGYVEFARLRMCPRCKKNMWINFGLFNFKGMHIAFKRNYLCYYCRHISEGYTHLIKEHCLKVIHKNLE